MVFYCTSVDALTANEAAPGDVNLPSLRQTRSSRVRSTSVELVGPIDHHCCGCFSTVVPLPQRYQDSSPSLSYNNTYSSAASGAEANPVATQTYSCTGTLDNYCTTSSSTRSHVAGPVQAIPDLVVHPTTAAPHLEVPPEPMVAQAAIVAAIVTI